MKTKALSLIILGLFALKVHSQEHVIIARKTFIFPAFKQDSVTSFNNYFVKEGVVPSIKQSKYEFEIRCNFYGTLGWFPGEGRCIIIRGNKDSLYAIDYFLKNHLGFPKRYDSVAREIKTSNGNIQLHVRLLKPKEAIKTLLQQLISNDFTNLADDNITRAQLKKKNVVLKDFDGTDCCASITYDVKLGNKFRNFTTNYYYQAYNQNIKALKKELNIDSVFTKLVPNFLQ